MRSGGSRPSERRRKSRPEGSTCRRQPPVHHPPSTILLSTFHTTALQTILHLLHHHHHHHHPLQVDHTATEYAPFRRNLYVEVPELKAMSDADVEALKKSLDGIKTTRKRVPRPIKRWAQAGLSDRLLAVIEKQGYAALRPPPPPPPHPPPPPPVQVRGAVPDPGAGAAVHHERARRHRGREDGQRQDDGVRPYAPPRRRPAPPRATPRRARLRRRPHPPSLSLQVRAADASSRDGPASAPGDGGRPTRELRCR